jgi:hypothetical protein
MKGKKMRKILTVTGLAAAAISLASLTACGGATKSATPAAHQSASAPSTAPDPPTNAGPANPVPVIKLAGATTSAVYGQTDLYGDRYASGDLLAATIPSPCMGEGSSSTGCDESVDVYTYANAAAQAAGESRNQTSDGSVIISGHLFDLIVYGVQGISGSGTPWEYPVSVATIAARVDGKILVPAN